MNEYFKKVYDIVSQVPEGKVTTYGQIAAILNNTANARVVGWAMRAAPEHLDLPCHRVVYKSGDLTPAFTGGVDGQRELLEKEGVTFDESGRVNMDKHLWFKAK